MTGPGRARVAPGPGGPWSALNFAQYQLSQVPSAQCFAQHQFSQVTNFWKQGRPANFHLRSLNNGQAELSLTFQLPSPSEIIPPPSPYSTTPFPTSNVTPNHPAPPTKRPIVPLFPKLPTLRPSPGPPQDCLPRTVFPGLSSKQRKSYRRAELHRASQASPPLPPRKRPRSSSLPSSPGSSPATLSQQLRSDFNI